MDTVSSNQDIILPVDGSTGAYSAVIFDVGKVLIDFDLSRFYAYLRSAGAKLSSTQEFVSAIRYYDYERGHISTEQFLERVIQICPRAEKEKLIYYWQDVFTPRPEMLELLRTIRRHHRVFLMSNSNELHWDHVERCYGVSSWSEGAICSHHVGAMKPDPLIYQTAVERHSLVPQQTIFVDDLLENAQGAANQGWTAVHHQSFERTKGALLALGVKIC